MRPARQPSLFVCCRYCIRFLEHAGTRPSLTRLTSAVMFITIQIVWNLQIPRGQTAAIITIFASEFICIAFATLRVIQIGRQTGDQNIPNPNLARPLDYHRGLHRHMHRLLANFRLRVPSRAPIDDRPKTATQSQHPKTAIRYISKLTT